MKLKPEEIEFLKKKNGYDPFITGKPFAKIKEINQVLSKNKRKEYYNKYTEKQNKQKQKDSLKFLNDKFLSGLGQNN